MKLLAVGDKPFNGNAWARWAKSPTRTHGPLRQPQHRRGKGALRTRHSGTRFATTARPGKTEYLRRLEERPVSLEIGSKSWCSATCKFRSRAASGIHASEPFEVVLPSPRGVRIDDILPRRGFTRQPDRSGRINSRGDRRRPPGRDLHPNRTATAGAATPECTRRISNFWS